MQPSVCAVCITADRPDFTARAVECFEAQSYQSRRLVIFDTSKAGNFTRYTGHFQHVVIGGLAQTISALRNAANAFAAPEEVIVHWDSDDWSHPERIAEQVALLQASGAAAVGYNEMLFWRQTPKAICDRYAEVQCRYPTDPGVPVPAHLQLRLGEAWLYRGSILGTSLCYWRETWERVPFRAIRLNPNHQQGTGEDHDFMLDIAAKGMNTAQQSSLPMTMEKALTLAFPEGPRMIGGIHGANTSKAYDPAQMRAHPQHWTRVPAWDKFCLETMKI